MTAVLPRLERTEAQLRIDRARGRASEYVSSQMPDLEAPTSLPTTGVRISDELLFQLRTQLVALARENGFPGKAPSVPAFDGACARLLHDVLPISPHEAADEGAWSYLTCCWLLDIAMWRYPGDADENRFIGHLNRNTFRRLWWRAETFVSEIDLTALNEDELVSIMERSSLAADRRLASAIGSEFLVRINSGRVRERMHLMRQATMRLRRLTPFVSLGALAEPDVVGLVHDAFDAAELGLTGVEPPRRQPAARTVAEASPYVTQVQQHSGLDVAVSESEIAAAALKLAASTGRVTNGDLRAVTDVTSEQARQVLQGLTDAGALVRRGVRRGTYYLLAEAAT